MKQSVVAYFSMEIGLDARIPTYSGGLGVLAGDTIRSAADMAIPMVAVTLLHRHGYFHQKLDATGWQTGEPVKWPVEDYLVEMPARTTVTIEGRTVTIRPWRYEMAGSGGGKVPVFFLDTDLPENSEFDRSLTDNLYGGDDYYRLCQEVILGTGGVRILRALGYKAISRFHMNEGHASLLVLELLEERLASDDTVDLDSGHFDAIHQKCVFTTHTPVPAGHDQFPIEMALRVLGKESLFAMRQRRFSCEGKLNMTYLALENSHFINGVAKRHRDTSQQMFSHFCINSITNGIHAASWASPYMQELLDRSIPGWREDNASLRYAISIPADAVRGAHQQAKQALIEYVNRVTNSGMDENTLTIGYARRATLYKRPELLFHDIERLAAAARAAGPLQIIYAGKAHPQDQAGKGLIQNIFRIKDELDADIHLVYLPNYDMELAAMMIAGSDVWLNTPRPPHEASGTSGMKAAVNGVPSLSILDGWWLEGCIEGVTGWAIGKDHESLPDDQMDAKDAADLYDKLENVVMPMFYGERDRFAEIMRSAIGINASFFNTERMLSQYVARAYFK